MANQKMIKYKSAEYEPAEMIERSRFFFDQISKRRSVRDFSDREIPLDVIENCIMSAGSAPSGANMQPWYFAVVRDPKVKKEIREAAEKEEHEFYSARAPKEWLDALSHLGTDEHKPYLEKAPYLIVIFEKRYSVDVKGEKIKHYYTSESTGIAAGFLIAALHNAGIASLTHTPSPMKFLNKILNRPSEERPFLILVAGYPAEEVEVPDISRKSFKEIAGII